MKKKVLVMFNDTSSSEFDDIEDCELNAENGYLLLETIDGDEVIINMSFVAYYKVIY